MEFNNIQPPKFDVHKAPAPYPDNPVDKRTGNYTNDDKDFSSGSSFSPGDVSQLHTRSDVDSSRNAQHHTLGLGRNEASPGDHIHDGYSSKKVGQGLSITISGSRGGNVALASLIGELKKVIDITDNTTP
jgi:hypothetical protein